MNERYRQLEALQERAVALEREARALRGAVAQAMRCTCPVGFGQERDANCPRHSGGSPPVEGVCVGGELDGEGVPACPTCGAKPLLLEVGVETVVEQGMAPSRQGTQARCERGHWYTIDGVPSQGPISCRINLRP